MEMPQVTVEYMIMVPILIAQIFLFPFAATIIMNTWVDSRRTLSLQEAASSMSSSMQQLYSSLNHDTISAGAVRSSLVLPRYIEDYPYAGNATLRTVGSGVDGSRVLEITLKYVGVSISTTALVTFGANLEWKNSTFLSNSTSPSIIAEKFVNGTIQMVFG